MTALKTALKSDLDDAYATIRTLTRIIVKLDEELELNPGVSGEGDSS